MKSVSTTYTEVKDRVAALVLPLSDDELERTVPACPEWSIHDVVRHVTAGIVEASAGGSPEFMDGLELGEHWRDPGAADALDRMVRRQLDEWRGLSVPALVDVWATGIDKATAMLDGETPWPAPWTDEPMGYVLAADVIVHECDLRDALGLEPPDDLGDLWFGVVCHATALDGRLKTCGRPAISLDIEGQELTVGEGAAAARVTASPYDVLMMLTGRFTVRDIAALTWDGPHEAFLDIISSYEPPRP